jgi:hypothetical protein
MGIDRFEGNAARLSLPSGQNALDFARTVVRSMILGAALWVPGDTLPLQQVMHQVEPAERQPDPRMLLEKLRTIEGIKITRDPLLIADPKAPTIILVEDWWHGFPEVEESVLKLLRKELGVSFVGFEGWAGADVDRKRGRTILNAEEKLIETFWKDADYTCIGLEEPQLQLDALRLVCAREYFFAQQCDERMKKTKVKTLIPILKNMRDSSKRGAEAWMQKLGHAPTEEQFQRLICSVECTVGHELPVLFSEPQRKTNDAVYKKHVVVDRSEAGVRKMQEEMRRRGISVGTMVFGRGHTDSIFQYARDQKKTHLIAVAGREDGEK